jgi:hypothetical protein
MMQLLVSFAAEVQVRSLHEEWDVKSCGVLSYHCQDEDLHVQILCGISVQKMLGTASCQYQPMKTPLFSMT